MTQSLAPLKRVVGRVYLPTNSNGGIIEITSATIIHAPHELLECGHAILSKQSLSKKRCKQCQDGIIPNPKLLAKAKDLAVLWKLK